ncbi:hypothetical protein O0I10_004613 [Lichtheimia ornata]|uniref:Extracellular membrane protein CFEM domain-containing protein n=1 Tax=Lichtheimia ornata TaxID=688661 RepID=A0AAD7V5C2_9FUNG|nr:uncharacterized protein O0I10_004613 [Lichtheimia ornata]KAJ8659634.1 hypothetical protein O0I10_004613 [Lichtheimia ornata]
MRSLVFVCCTVVLALKCIVVLGQAPAGCTDQQVFSQCLKNEDNYLKTCKSDDFACLCKWNRVKLQCWDNSCPNDPARATQAGVVENYCGVAKANSPATTAAASSTMAQSSSKLPSASSTAQPTTSSSLPPSSGSASETLQIADKKIHVVFASLAITLLLTYSH